MAERGVDIAGCNVNCLSPLLMIVDCSDLYMMIIVTQTKISLVSCVDWLVALSCVAESGAA